MGACLRQARERHVTVLETTAAPGSSAGDALYTLPSECEVCFVLEGTVEVEVDDERFTLGPGDALTFGAAVPHTWRNASADAGLAYCGSSPRRFPTRERRPRDAPLR